MTTYRTETVSTAAQNAEKGFIPEECSMKMVKPWAGDFLLTKKKATRFGHLKTGLLDLDQRNLLQSVVRLQIQEQ